MTEKTVLLDVRTAGTSGDMFLSALLDLLGDQEALVPVAASLLIYDPTIRVSTEQVSMGDVSGIRLHVQADLGLRLSPEAIRDVLRGVCEELELSSTATSLANKILDEILQAESRAHDMPIEQLHLHETGSVDTVLDIVGTAYLLERAGLLGNARFVSTPVAVGSGTIKTEHGDLEVPVPAVAEILVAHDVPFEKGDAKTEVLTPTGAAILVTLVNEFVDSIESFEAIEEGVGFGTRDLGNVPNMMRIAVGRMAQASPEKTVSEPKRVEPEVEPQIERAPSQSTAGPTIAEEESDLQRAWETDEVVVIEANVDDVDGEAIGNIFDALLSDALAYDVVMIPAYGKKNRPCYVVKVIAAESQLDRIAEIMVRHLGTLGVRYTKWNRLKAVREVIVCRLEIDDKEYMVRVKISRGPDGSIVNIKPEADDIVKVSAETGIPVRELKPRVAMQAFAVTE